MARHPNLKLLICDDGSTPENVELNKAEIHAAETLRKRAGLQMLMHDARRGIAASWNTLARHEQADIVVWLNDDIEVVDHWLDALAYTLLHNESLGMVGLNSLISVSRSALASLYPPGSPLHLIRPRVDYNEAHMLDGGGTLLSSQGCAFGMTREAYDAAGGFDERYFAFYEELDMGVTLRRRGRRSYVLSYPLVFHLGGATNSVPSNLNAAEHMARSRALFQEKWGKTVAELRAEVSAEPPPAVRLREWNTQIHNWR